MDRHGLSSALWIQQIGAASVGTAICVCLIIASPRPARSRAWVLAAFVAAGLVAATLAFPGVEGVRRWIPVGPLRLHASALALPILIIALGAAGRSDRRLARRSVQGVALVVAVILVAQPDASQVTAVGGAAAVLLLLRNRGSAATWLVVAAFTTLAALAWTRSDPLLPVPHVEGIVGLAALTGGSWRAAACLALGLLPLPFVIASFRGSARREDAAALAVYFGILCLAPAFGAYPVPVMGFGLSYILGYYAALAWLVVAAAKARAGCSRAVQAG
jgi:hypothetical protein